MNTSNHPRKPVGRARLTTGLLAAFVSAASVAAERSPAYTMTVIHDAYYGGDVMSGEYSEAIDRIRSKSGRAGANFEANTNLCVAYVKSGDVSGAAAACDAAVREARKRSSRASRFAPSYAEENWREYEALALSNRGVLHAVTGKPGLARNDFARALELSTRIDAPGSNLALLAEDAPM